MKDTVMTQLAAGASVAAQVFVCANSLAFTPVRETLLIAKVSDPVFFSVIVCVALVELIFVFPKVREVGVYVVAGIPRPVPVTASD